MGSDLNHRFKLHPVRPDATGGGDEREERNNGAFAETHTRSDDVINTRDVTRATESPGAPTEELDAEREGAAREGGQHDRNLHWGQGG
jgi:hypothetical protein